MCCSWNENSDRFYMSNTYLHNATPVWLACCQVCYLITSAERRRLCFRLCWFVCLCVCLSICLLATLRENAITHFHEISGLVGLCTRNNLDYFQDPPFNPLNTATLFFKHFRGNPCLLAIWRNNKRTDFHKIFNKSWMWNKKQSGTFRGCCN